MRLLSFALHLGIGATFLPAGLAQSITPFQGEMHVTAWPANVSAAGSFGRADSGSFVSGFYRDVIQLDGDQPTLLVDPDLGLAPTAMPVAAIDIATLTGASPSGLDAIAVVSAAGLELWWWDATLETWGSRTLDALAWAGAVKVRTADLDANAGADIFGVAADGSTVLTMLAGSGGVFTAGPSFVAPDTVDAIDAVRWDGDADLEIGVLTDLGVEVRELDGTLHSSFSAALPGGTLCTLRQAGQAQERLVWITEYTVPGQQLLMTLSPLGVDDQVDLGALQAFAVVATDYDLDGDDDILISHRYSYELLRVENQRTPANPTGLTFVDDPGAMGTFTADAPGTAPNNDAWPVIADLDGDGDDDVAFACEKSGNFLVFRGEAVSQDELCVGVTPVDYVVTAPESHGHLNLTLASPVVLDPSATHLELDVWRQASPTADIEYMAVGHQELALPGSWPASLAVRIPEGDCEFTSAYHYQIRVVEQDVGGEVTTAYPTYTGTFSLIGADVDAYAGDEALDIPSDVLAPTPQNATFDPGSMRRKRVRTFPTGNPPVVKSN